MEGSSLKPAQISDMWNKFTLSFKSKALDFFSDDPQIPDPDPFTLPDHSHQPLPDPPPPKLTPTPSTINPQFNQTLIASLFATISSFEASYLQLQTAHVPFDEDAIRVADNSLVSHLQTLSEFKQLYGHYHRNPNLCVEFSTGSCLEFQVNENQTKLRALKSVFNRLQAEIDVKDGEVEGLRRGLEAVELSNSMLGTRLGNSEVLLTVRVFEKVLEDVFGMSRRFTKVLIGLMRRAEWDLDLAADSVYSGVGYAKRGHSRYSLLSYVCLRMFHVFDSVGFGLDGGGVACLERLVQHIAVDPMESLRKDPDCEFSRFCEGKYQQLIHPTMESLIFSDLDRDGEVVNSWKSLSGFYEAFVKMASAIWTLHNLAFSFDPPVRIFQVENGGDFSSVYMEDVTGKFKPPCRTRPKVGFTVVPGFKIGQTVIQSKVYLTGMECPE